jgi:hypothetical protein
LSSSTSLSLTSGLPGCRTRFGFGIDTCSCSHPESGHLGLAEVVGTDSGSGGGRCTDDSGKFSSGGPKTTPHTGHHCSYQFSISPVPIARNTLEISRGKTRYLLCVNAGFTKCTPTADGGLNGHMPDGPRCITPHVGFLFIAPQFRIGLPPHPASQRRTCPSPCLRLCENLAPGLSPEK